MFGLFHFISFFPVLKKQESYASEDLTCIFSNFDVSTNESSPTYVCMEVKVK